MQSSMATGFTLLPPPVLLGILKKTNLLTNSQVCAVHHVEGKSFGGIKTPQHSCCFTSLFGVLGSILQPSLN